jgi:hypothetical protein
LLGPVIKNSFNTDKPGIIQAGKLGYIYVVGVNAAVWVRQYCYRLFWYYESDDIYSDRFVEAEDLNVIQRSIDRQLTLEDLFHPSKHFRLLL